MKLNQLKPQAGARKVAKRRGRGEGSGNGGTAGRGHNGDKARSGHKAKRGFEGGQMPLQRRLPKRGFKSLIEGAQEVSLARLASLTAIEFDVVALKKAGFIRSIDGKVKVIGNAKLERAITVKVHAASAGAKAAIEAAGGRVEIIEG
ncbi:MAG: 50S ribosomal protein L15 [Fibrobacteria bacterium]|nr:50S ribosomal protein L15 [Fibrobacteria bacterium]